MPEIVTPTEYKDLINNVLDFKNEIKTDMSAMNDKIDNIEKKMAELLTVFKRIQLEMPTKLALAETTLSTKDKVTDIGGVLRRKFDKDFEGRKRRVRCKHKGQAPIPPLPPADHLNQQHSDPRLQSYPSSSSGKDIT